MISISITNMVTRWEEKNCCHYIIIINITITINIILKTTNMVTRWEEKEGYRYTIM